MKKIEDLQVGEIAWDIILEAWGEVTKVTDYIILVYFGTSNEGICYTKDGKRRGKDKNPSLYTYEIRLFQSSPFDAVGKWCKCYSSELQKTYVIDFIIRYDEDARFCYDSEKDSYYKVEILPDDIQDILNKEL